MDVDLVPSPCSSLVDLACKMPSHLSLSWTLAAMSLKILPVLP